MYNTKYHPHHQLALAIALALSTGFVSANVWYGEAQRETGLTFNTGQSFIDDSSFTLTARSASYYREGYRDGRTPISGFYSDDYHRKESALALYGDFQSGWLWGTLGFDLGVYGQKALLNTGNPENFGIFYKTNDVDDTSKIGVANLKFQHNFSETAGIHGRLGRMKVDWLPFFYGDTFAAMPTTFEGALLNGYWGRLSGYIARFTGHSHYKVAGMNRLQGGGRDGELDATGLRWGNAWEGGLSLAVDYAEQNDYLEKTKYEMQYGFSQQESHIVLTASYLTQDAGRDYSDPNHDAKLVYGEVAYSHSSLNSYLGISFAGDRPFDTYFTDDIFAATVRTVGLWNDFNQKDMTSVVIGGDYNLISYGLPRWTLFFNGIYGWGADKDTPTPGATLPISSSRAYETASGFTYEVFDGPVQGLWLNTTWIRDGGGYYSHDGLRILLDYTLKVF
ncbi:OprD family outer membrane porin [Parendozoicomonas haliclonae]|uniref:Outer membrane porin, OprD family n=1 Tax=Parendozoicomonas haliclonae TaxID=1960125 RepID=A0A1X7ARG4_9GAMM|nr:OprD family outer membrane porin [Parendozoicomonas haliclonae]SMA50911.1 outer membrane porin, OprD family [Parendozoicomonas haliclonae]